MIYKQQKDQKLIHIQLPGILHQKIKRYSKAQEKKVSQVIRDFIVLLPNAAPQTIEETNNNN